MDINTMCTVTLTKLGAKVFNKFYIYPVAREGDEKEMPLWLLSKIFGDLSGMFVGGVVNFI